MCRPSGNGSVPFSRLAVITPNEGGGGALLRRRCIRLQGAPGGIYNAVSSDEEGLSSKHSRSRRKLHSLPPRQRRFQTAAAAAALWVKMMPVHHLWQVSNRLKKSNREKKGKNNNQTTKTSIYLSISTLPSDRQKISWASLSTWSTTWFNMSWFHLHSGALGQEPTDSKSSFFSKARTALNSLRQEGNLDRLAVTSQDSVKEVKNFSHFWGTQHQDGDTLLWEDIAEFWIFYFYLFQ